MVDVTLSAARLLLAFVLVALNGFFVAAEFAYVRIRATTVETLVKEGKPGATTLQEGMDNLDDYLAVTQLGITIASLGLGWVGEPAVVALIEPVLGSVLSGQSLHLVAFALGFSFVTFLHVVFGELAPKTIAIARAERIALLVAPPMKVFYYLFVPGIIVFNGTANFFTRLIGIPPASESDETLTEEELLAVLARSGREGNVAAEEVDMIERVFELDDVSVREVMVPRPDVVSVPADTPIGDLRDRIVEVGYTRLPVIESDDDQVIGYVDTKDILRMVAADDDGTDEPVGGRVDAADDIDQPETARDIAREILVVPESERAIDLLAKFRGEQRQMAAIIDEWGVFEGIATVEDVVEVIVGDLRDEFDVSEREPSIRRRTDGSYVVDGSVTVSTVNDALDTEFETDEFETIAGLILDRLGRAPEVGDEVDADGYVLRIREVDGARISTVAVREIERDGDEDSDDGNGSDADDEVDTDGDELDDEPGDD